VTLDEESATIDTVEPNANAKGPDRTDLQEGSVGDRGSEGAPTTTPWLVRVGSALKARRIPLFWSAVFIGLGLLYMFEYGPFFFDNPAWVTGGDLWGIFRAAHYVGWGFPGGIYDPSTGVVTFPGMSVLLAPVAMVSGGLGLSESAPGVTLAHPTAALLLQPVELLLGCTLVFASDSTAKLLGLSTRARFVLVGAVALVALHVAAVWGHSEDLVAVAFLLWSFQCLRTDRSRPGGWIMGLGILMQPLVGLALPLLVGMSTAKDRVRLVVRSVAPSAVLVGIALLGNWSETIHTIVKQPTPPSINHATPWLPLAPRIGKATVPFEQSFLRITTSGQREHFLVTHVHQPAVVIVSGGPPRMIGVFLALLIGLWVWRRRPDTVGLFWLMTLALSMRCYFEAVMTPYYTAPALVLGLIAAARMGRWRFAIAFVAAAGDTVYGYFRFSPWVWWLPVVALLTVVLACGYPGWGHLEGRGVVLERNDASADDRLGPPPVTDPLGDTGRPLSPRGT